MLFFAIELSIFVIEMDNIYLFISIDEKKITE
jgi:hypothetical protein